MIFTVFADPTTVISGFAGSGVRGRTELGEECIPMEPPASPLERITIIEHAFSDTTPPITFSGSFAEPLSAGGTYRVVTQSWVPPPGPTPPPPRRGSTCDTGPVSWTASCKQVNPTACLPLPTTTPLPPTGNTFPTFSGSATGATVSRSGRVTLPLTIGCPPPGSVCAIAVAAHRKQVRIGRSRYLVAVDRSAKTRFKLTRKGRSLLRRLTRIKAKVVITVSRGGNIVSQKTVTARLKAPRPAR